MSKSRFGILIAIFVLFISGVMTAQDTTNTWDQNSDKNNSYQQDPTMHNEATEAAVNDLKTRLNLREDQVQDISDIVDRYHRESVTMQTSPQNTNEEIRINANTELKSRYNTEIETLLDENQKVQFREYSETWWNSVKSTESQDGTEVDRDYNREDTDIRDGVEKETEDPQIDGTDTQDGGTETEESEIR